MKTRHIPRRCWKKLWKWCLRQSASGTVTVRVLSSNRDGYYLLRTEHRKRIGRSIPVITYHEKRTTIEWEYVY